jgi:hypothetical protein
LPIGGKGDLARIAKGHAFDSRAWYIASLNSIRFFKVLESLPAVDHGHFIEYV